MKIRKQTIDYAIIAGLLFVALWSMASKGAPQAWPLFVSALMLPFGFGKIIWSQNPPKEWVAMFFIMSAVIISVSFQSFTPFVYGGLMMTAQLLLRLISLSWRKH